MRAARTLGWLAVAAVAWPGVAGGQNPDWNAASVHASRPSLEQLERRYEAAAESPAYSGVLRAEAREEAAKLRQRLRNGDFQVGDRVLLTVEGDTVLTDTFTVVQDRVLELTGLGPVSLHGVLRSEVESHLRTFVQRYLRDPVVRARTFVRVAVAGEVQTPGFYVVPTDLVLSDAMRIAGGLTDQGRVTDVSILRSNAVLWDATSLAEALSGGQTLDQLDVRSGDQIVVGRRGGFGLGGLEGPVRTISIFFAIPLTIAGVVTLF
jgi:protein involved in polysaccharide export with SLBB domain